MKPRQLLLLLPCLAMALPRQHTPGTATERTVHDSSSDAIAPRAEPGNSLERRLPPDGKAGTISAKEAASRSGPGTDKAKVFFRGDSRPPSDIFQSGFAPQGKNLDLQSHLNFAGGSGYVSLSRSQDSARLYAFGRTGQKKDTGYLYVVKPKEVPNGYYVPDVYSKDRAVQRNKEFAVAGPVPPSAISGAFEMNSNTKGKPKWHANPEHKSSGCFGKKRAVCDYNPWEETRDDEGTKVEYVESEAPLGNELDEARGRDGKAEESAQVNGKDDIDAAAGQAKGGEVGQTLEGNTIEAGAGEIERLPSKVAGESIHGGIAHGLGYLQAARLLTSVVDSAVARLNGSSGEIEKDLEQHDYAAALRESGSVLLGVANDTMPGFADIQQQGEELQAKLRSIHGASALDSASQALAAVAEHESKVQLAIFANYAPLPGLAEAYDNYGKELRDFAGFRGAETTAQRAERIAGLVGKGLAGTANDVLRDWLPGYAEAEDVAREEAPRRAREMLARAKQPSGWLGVLASGFSAAQDGFVKTLHRIAQNYIPGEKQLEKALGG